MAVAAPAVHVFLWGNAPTTNRDLTLAKDAGFQWIKQRFEWRNIEVNGPGQYQWNEPDRIVAAAQAKGLKILARVDNQPKWAASRAKFPASGAPQNLSDWTKFLTALATRYKGKIGAYEIWNEPNLEREWGSKPDPAAYARLLNVSYSAIKDADPDAIVVSAGLSPTTNNSDQAMPDVTFLQGMYTAGAKGNFDVLGAHAPGFKAPPSADPAQVAASADLTNHDPSPTEAKRVYAFRHVEDLRAIMVKAGDASKQIAITEMGYTTDQRPNSPYAWFAVSQQEQGQRLVQSFQYARQHWAPWIGLMTVIYIPDPSWTPQQEEYWWSITNPDGTPRPAYNVLKQYLTSTKP